MATKRLQALSALAKPAAAAITSSAATAATAATSSLPLTYEQRVWAASPHALLCGVDEAGRGPLAGPVVAAACVALPPALWSGPPLPLPGVNDSKQVDEAAREALFPALLAHPALCFGVSVVDHAAVDRVNVLAAAMLAMERAVAAARAAAAARLALPLPPHASAAGLPAADAVDWAAAGAAAPPPLRKPPPGVRADAALHTVFIDGPRCPTRIAEAAGGGYEGGGGGGGGAPRKRGRAAEGGAAAGAPAAASAGTVVDAAVDAGLRERLGPVFTAQPVIGGDGKVFLIAAGALPCLPLPRSPHHSRTTSASRPHSIFSARPAYPPLVRTPPQPPSWQR